jgi:PEGA domain
MRLELAAILTAALPIVGAAQSSRQSPVATTAPLPPIGLPLPPIGLPLPPFGLSPAIETPRLRDGRPSHPMQDQHRRHSAAKGRRTQQTVVYVVPAYPWNDYPAAPGFPDPSSEYREMEPLVGTLRLDVQPMGVAQVYVDGFYVGMLGDFGGELALEAGPHTIEIRADGYERVSLDVRIPPGRAITYRASLVRQTPSATPAAPTRSPDVEPAASQPVYFIPGCYLGNIPPKDVRLPDSCDRSRVKTLEQ